MLYKHFKELSKRVKARPSVGQLLTIDNLLDKTRKKVQDTADCLICGRLFISVPLHVRQIHHLSLKEYRKRFGDVKVWGDDYRSIMVENARRIGKSEKAVGAREKYWSEDGHKEEKSRWMVEELKRRLVDKSFRKKWENRESLVKFIKGRKEAFATIERERKVCAVCGKVFKPSTFIRNGSIRHDVHWRIRKVCSRRCANILLSKGKSKEEKMRMSISKARFYSGWKLVNGKARFSKKCAICGKQMWVPHWQLMGKYERITCSLSCASGMRNKIKQLGFKEENAIK